MRRLFVSPFLLLPIGCHVLVSLDDLQGGSAEMEDVRTGGAPGAGAPGDGDGDGDGDGLGGEENAPTRPRVTSAPLACPREPSAPTTTLLVESDGNDGGDGSAAAPLASVTRALELATAGTLIRIGEGVFDEPGTLIVPPSVSLAGSGRTTTKLRVPGGTTALISLSEPQDNSISGLDIDGRNRSVAYGIHAVGATGLTIADVLVQQFTDSGLRVENGAAQPEEITVCGSVFDSCGKSDPAFSPFADMGCLHLDPPRKTLISDVRISTDLGSGIRIDSASSALLEDVVVEFVDIHVPPVRDQIASPQNALSMRNVTFSGVEIRESHMDGLLSVWQTGDEQQDVRIHHNTLSPQSVALEVDANGAEVDHNLVFGQVYWMINLNHSGLRTDLDVHHNLIIHPGDPHPLGEFFPAMDRVRFTSNTVHFSGNLSGTEVFGFLGGGTDHLIQNNIFLDTTSQSADSWDVVESTTVKANLFDGIEPPSGHTESLLESPGFDLENEQLDERYRLPETSPAQSAGRDIETNEPIPLGACVTPEAPCVGASWEP